MKGKYKKKMTHTSKQKIMEEKKSTNGTKKIERILLLCSDEKLNFRGCFREFQAHLSLKNTFYSLNETIPR